MTNQDDQTYLQLSVWMPARLSTKLISYATSDASGLEGERLRLHEQIYRWEASEDPWSGISEPNKITEARELLTESFSPSMPPDDRNFDRFAELITLLDQLCEQALWTDCVQSDSLEIPYRANQLLVVRNHFEWIYNIFCTLPGASVMVR